LEPEDEWRPGRLTHLESLLWKNDLILSTNETVRESSDWLMALLSPTFSHDWAITSSAVIRRTLFDEAGGFPEGYWGFPLPKRLPGFEAYELWLRALAVLVRSEKRDRFLLVPNTDVVTGPKVEFAHPLYARVQMLRETVSLVHLAKFVPRRYWTTLARRLLESGKGVIKG
jgi:hypothetical protein